MDLNCILSIVEGGINNHYQHINDSRVSVSDCSQRDRHGININLLEADLWHKFHDVTNEMIVTKSGRRMFPVIKLSIDGLEARAMYSVAVEFVQIGSHRWKYMNGDWVAGGKSEPAPQQSQSLYIHPESPNFGAHWMKDAISFSKVKLTNKPSAQSGQVVLNSLHKYEPRVHIIRVDSQDEREKIFTFRFPETQFIAVTAYQNEEVTQLKIRYNPFAKAFQDARDRPNEMNNNNHTHNHASSQHITMQLQATRTNTMPSSSPPSDNWSGNNVSNLPNNYSQSVSGGSSPYCERISTLRNHRSMPYSRPVIKRSPSPYAASTCTYETSQSHYQPPSWTPHLQPTANPTIEPIWSSFPEPNVAVYPHNPTTIYHHQQESPSSVIPTMPTTQSSPNSHNVTYPDCLSL